MDPKLAEIGVQLKKIVMFSFTSLHRTVCRNPFLVCMLFFLIFLYRFFPLLFSLLLSASPVLVSTAVLLGTLLSFGQPNIPEIEKEETVRDDVVSLKTGMVTRDSLVVEGDTSHHFIQRYSRDEKERDVEGKSIEETYSLANNVSKVDRDEFVVPTSPPREEKSREFLFDDAQRESSKETKGIENQYFLIQQSDDENDGLDTDNNSPKGSVDSPVGEDQLNLSSGMTLKEEEEEEEEQSDSGSDGDESSSPDASMADIIPMLDELHPLLDEEETNLPAHVSDADKSGNGSDPDSEIHEDLEVAEEEDKEEEAKAAISWTEDDEKNLMNLGTSELERNRRLESLIARRRSRKNMRMMAERNLIDFESSDLPFNVAPISTSRKNPFDLPFDSNENIPGSAPSILLPRRNPFDLPYDSSEEKPDLVGDTFLQESVTFHTKEQPMMFRRHESFNVGPSIFGGFRQEKQDIKLRPFFVPERMEDTNFSFLQRQSSEMSESKVSSVPETEEGLHASQHIEEHASESSEDVDNRDNASETSEDVEKRDLELKRHENVIKLGGEDNHQETESYLSEAGSIVNLVDLNAEAVDKNISRSSSSSDLDVNETIFSEKEDALLSLEQTPALIIEESQVLIQHKEPVYDLSPRSSIKVESHLPSVSSDPPVVKRTVSLDTNETEPKEVGELCDGSVDQEDSSDNSIKEDSLHKDQSLGVPDEEQPLVGEAISVTQLNNLIDKEVVLGDEQDQVDQSNIDEKSMNPSTDNKEELKESLIIVRESTDDASPSHSLHVSDNEAFRSSVTESELTPGLSDPRENVLNEIENDAEISELNPNDSHSNLQNNTELEEDEIKEIDEGLLSELDAVGDFSVKDLKEIVKHAVQGSSAVLESKDISLNIEDEISRYKDKMVAVDDDLGLKQNPVVEVHEIEDFGPVNVMHVLEARSVEDIELGFNQAVNKEEIENPNQVEATYEEIVVKGVEDNVVHSDSNFTENKVELPVAESRSIEDATVDLNQVPEGNVEKLVNTIQVNPAHEGIVGTSVEDNMVRTDLNYEENKVELPVVESRSSEDAIVDLNQVPEGNLEKPVISDLGEGIVKFEAKEAGSSKDKESDNYEKAEHEVEEKKKKSSKSGSQSSSSSSSSSSLTSSDSDKE